MPKTGDIICIVTMPNSYELVIETPKSASGYFVFNKVCEKLQLLQKDFFGLQVIDEDQTKRWLNLRNLIVSEVGNVNSARFIFEIKFFVQTHYLLQESTREVFFQIARNHIIQTKMHRVNKSFLKSSLEILSQYYELDDIKLNSLLTEQNDSNDEILEKLISLKMSTNFIFIPKCQSKMVNRNETRSLFLKNVSLYMNTIGHTYSAELDKDEVVLGVLPGGLSFLSQYLEPIKSYTWSSLQQATQNGSEVTLKIISDDSSIKTLKFVLHNKTSANAYYRDLTEVYTFFHCDSVSEPVMQQFCRDLKGTFAALFVDNSNYGKEYVFDIEHTLKEADDQIKRHIYKEEKNRLNVRNNVKSNNKYRLPNDFDKENVVPASNSNDEELMCSDHCRAALKLIEIHDAFVCCICADSEVSTALIPCGHVFTCCHCSERIERCPICTQEVKSTVRLYLPFAFDQSEGRERKISL